MRDGTGDSIGVLALQLPNDDIREIMQFSEGMGESGETYLVGTDLLMRSDSRFSEQSTILEVTVDSATVHQALGGQRGIDVTPDYRGVNVLSAYDFIDFNGVRWAVMAEIDDAEIKSRVGSIRASLAVAGLGLLAMVLVSMQALVGSEYPESIGLVGDIDMDLDPPL